LRRSPCLPKEEEEIIQETVPAYEKTFSLLKKKGGGTFWKPSEPNFPEKEKKGKGDKKKKKKKKKSVCCPKKEGTGESAFQNCSSRKKKGKQLPGETKEPPQGKKKVKRKKGSKTTKDSGGKGRSV